MPASCQLTSKLFLAVVRRVMRLLLRIRVYLGARLACEADTLQFGLDLTRETLGSEGFVAVRAGAVAVGPGPVGHARGAEHALAVRALLGLADDLSAHLADEFVIDLPHGLVFFQLRQFAV